MSANSETGSGCPGSHKAQGRLICTFLTGYFAQGETPRGIAAAMGGGSRIPSEEVARMLLIYWKVTKGPGPGAQDRPCLARREVTRWEGETGAR